MIDIKCFITDCIFKTNTYLIICKNTSEAIIIDPSDYCDELIEYIDTYKIKVKYILNTHSHPDHCAGNYRLYKKYKVTLLISKKEEELLINLINTGFIPKKNIPYTFIADGDMVRIGSAIITIFDTPGHTDGGISAVIGDCIFSGDLAIKPISDTVDGITRRVIVDKILSMNNTRIILFPGHGETIAYDELWRKFGGDSVLPEH